MAQKKNLVESPRRPRRRTCERTNVKNTRFGMSCGPYRLRAEIPTEKPSFAQVAPKLEIVVEHKFSIRHTHTPLVDAVLLSYLVVDTSFLRRQLTNSPDVCECVGLWELNHMLSWQGAFVVEVFMIFVLTARPRGEEIFGKVHTHSFAACPFLRPCPFRLNGIQLSPRESGKPQTD